MKKLILALAISSVTLLSGCVVAAATVYMTSQTNETHEIVNTCPMNKQLLADQAYLEYFPLLEQARWMQEDMTTTWGFERPTNTFNQMTQLITHEFSGVVAPNNDTLYTMFTIDVSIAPVVFTMPETDSGRYSSQLVIDAMHYEVSTDVNAPGRTVFIKKGYQGVIPEYDRLYELDSDLAYSLVRVEVIDIYDVPKASAILDQMKLEGVTRKAKDVFPPLDSLWTDQVKSMLAGTTLSESNQANLDCYIKRGLFDYSPNIIKLAKITGQTFMASKQADTSYFGNEASVPSVDHQTGRAIANYYWHLAFQPKHADYPSILVDNNGKSLSGDSVYELTFDKDLPIHDRGFWSMTTYITESRLFVPNDELKYKVGNKTVVLNDDNQTITITYSATKPANATNWMPTPQGEDFYIGVRLYEASDEWLDGKFTLPVPLKING